MASPLKLVTVKGLSLKLVCWLEINAVGLVGVVGVAVHDHAVHACIGSAETAAEHASCDFAFAEQVSSGGAAEAYGCVRWDFHPEELERRGRAVLVNGSLVQGAGKRRTHERSAPYDEAGC